MKKSSKIFVFFMLLTSMLNYGIEEEKNYEQKIVFETSSSPVCMRKRMKYNNVINDMEVSHYVLRGAYESFTEFDYKREYGKTDKKDFRRKAREYYTSRNLKIIEELGIENEILDYSEYTPYIYLKNDSNNSEDIYEKAYSLATYDSIQTVFVSQYKEAKTLGTYKRMSQEDTQTYSNDLRDIDYDAFPIGTEWTGEGVKIGILDESSLDVNHDNFSDCYVENVLDTYTANDNTSHGLMVASILGGKYGIANNASLYFADVRSRIDLLAIENLISKDCDVINMSIGLLNANGTVSYDASIEGYADYISNTSGAILVAAAGNGLDLSTEAGVVCLPAAAANVIAVGNYTAGSNYTTGDSSCFPLTSLISKPEIIAAGADRWIDGFGYGGGTSAASPAVAGTIALMIEKTNHYLTTEQAISILMGTADIHVLSNPTITVYNSMDNFVYHSTISVPNSENESTGLRMRSGSGKLNITRALEYTGGDRNLAFSPSPIEDATIRSFNVHLEEGQMLFVTYSMLRMVSTNIFGIHSSLPFPDVRFMVLDANEDTYTMPAMAENTVANRKKLTYFAYYTGIHQIYVVFDNVVNYEYYQIFYRVSW